MASLQAKLFFSSSFFPQFNPKKVFKCLSRKYKINSDEVTIASTYNLFLMTSLYMVVSAASAGHRTFPANFMFGASTSAYQIEGGWNASGKGENLWDNWVHNNLDTIEDKTTGDVSSDSYHKWELDVAACVKLGLDFYRFSISWSRILPTGFTNKINEDGLRYYNNLINMLLKNNIEPMVTLYHFDLPKKLHDLGGWTNPLIAGWFASYAEVVFTRFGDRVKYWVTINEPAVICELTYSPFMAPRISETLMAPYICNKNIIMAHAKAWRMYDKKFKPKYGGRVALVNHLVWFEPANENMTEATEFAREYLVGRYSHPIYSKGGGWPAKVEKFIHELSLKEGFKTSKLPSFTHDEKEYVKGTYDFYGMNHYTSRVVRKRQRDEDPGLWFTTGSSDLDIILDTLPDWEIGASAVLPIYPAGIRKQLAWLKQRYGDVDIIVTENGFSSTETSLSDHRRMKYIYDYLEQILLSIKIEHVSVIGYSYWSLIDGFEWMDGYSSKFGLYNVNFDDPNLPRVPRDSAKYYAAIIKNKALINPMVYSKQLHQNTKYTWKETHTQNGGFNAVQNGCFLLNTLVLLWFVL